MKLEDQVCSLELAKRLKELGVKQDSLYSYFQYDKWNVLLRETKEIYTPNNECGCNKDNLICSAYTFEELGKILHIGYKNFSETDAQAKIAIYLIENKLMKVAK